MTTASDANVQATFAATLVDEWVRGGVRHAVVAPGSRSTPMALALAADARIEVHVVLDERAASYRAVGIGLASGRPAVVLTTSGTAAAELHAAVVEAHQARVPLIAVTADRPPELHHVGAPQTIEQHELFAGAVRWAFDPGPASAATAGSWRSLGARTVVEAVAGAAGPGPVHLNVPFREPLLGSPGPLPEGRPGGAGWHVPARASAMPPADVVARLVASGRTGVIVAGGGAGDAAAIQAAAAVLGWPVLADPRSGARVPAATTVAAADAILRSAPFAAGHRPEVVLRLGAPWASRVVATWLAGLDAEQVLVDPYGAWADPDRTAAVVVSCDPTALCAAVADAAPVATDPSWLAGWTAAEVAAQAAIDDMLACEAAPTEPGVARGLVAGVPDGTVLLTSSSMPVRDVEWYARPRAGLRVVGNRGANGIDGVTSTALGVATARARTPAGDGDGPTVALLGDLAFLHDQGGLLGARASGVDCTLVVVDNDGGGIFSFLPQATAVAEDRFERLFGTPHGLDLGAIAAAHGIPVAVPESAAEVDEAIGDAMATGGVRMVHVRTDRGRNVAVHDEIHAAVAANLL